MESIEKCIQNIDTYTKMLLKHKELLAKTIFDTAKKVKYLYNHLKNNV